MNLPRKLTLLLTSAGRRVALLQAFREGAERLGLALTILACDRQPHLSAACQAANACFAVPRVDDPDYIDALQAIVRNHGVDLLVPTIDPELLPLAHARAAFAALGANVVTSGPALIALARDKLATADFLAAHGVPSPRTLSLADAREAGDEWVWPAILKPRHGSAGRSVRVVRSRLDLPAHEDEPMIVQELLQGVEWTVNLYFSGNGELLATVPHQRLQVRAGEVEKGVTIRDRQCRWIGGRLAEILPEPRGVLCYQGMSTPAGELAVFEINARFGGGYPLADRAGAKFARWLLEERLNLPSTASDDWTEGVVMLRYDAAIFVEP